MLSILDDDTSPMHFTELESPDGAESYTLRYPSRHYEPLAQPIDRMNVEMTVRVFIPWIFWSRREIAYDKINYNITKSLNGQLDVSQINRTIRFDDYNRAIVSASNSTKFTVTLDDPHGNNIKIIIYIYI